MSSTLLYKVTVSFTYFSDTLICVDRQHKNVTLSLPEPLLRKFRVYAAERNQVAAEILLQLV